MVAVRAAFFFSHCFFPPSSRVFKTHTTGGFGLSVFKPLFAGSSADNSSFGDFDTWKAAAVDFGVDQVFSNTEKFAGFRDAKRLPQVCGSNTIGFVH
jgi:hypothetical protein